MYTTDLVDNVCQIVESSRKYVRSLIDKAKRESEADKENQAPAKKRSDIIDQLSLKFHTIGSWDHDPE